MARLYTNENFPRPAVEELRKLGHDVLTTAEAGQANRQIPDEEVVAFASSLQRAVVTHNRSDFIRLHRASSQHSGIIVCKVQTDFRKLALHVHRVVGSCESLDGLLLR